MRVPELIMKKRDGGELTEAELKYLIDGMVSGEVPDYQMSALCMAIYFRGMCARETAAMTQAMTVSGSVVNLSAISGIKVDKHSTGGVGDTTTLVLAPMVAAAGGVVAKMSGRGLGHTGGTLDKLESIPGFRVGLSESEFISQVNRIGLAVVGQTGDIAPADKKLYALRDVTATVESIPLIAASIMSKKLATGADAIVLDVKTGSGAFMQKLEDAQKLAELMVEIGTLAGRRMAALITDMSQPLGMAIGNSLEVIEAIETLQGKVGGRLLEVCLELGARMLILSGLAESTEEGKALLSDALSSGRALDKLTQMIEAQGGDSACTRDPWILPVARCTAEIRAEQGGYVQRVDALTLGRAAMAMGAGRSRKEDDVDLACGIVVAKSIGDAVKPGEPLAKLYASSERLMREGLDTAGQAFAVGAAPVAPPTLIY
ncbi:MAG: Pyrimidine-nucleoside phosphorylase [Firmicutes bacterium ADurb.Bin506]|jgi:pyrimidine-nucleoside phosphorylase|nr:MAG: Pyrimidine-nucleoside phosphorylase [Firmicutes bacterium ADurb.Bin506]